MTSGRWPAPSDSSEEDSAVIEAELKARLLDPAAVRARLTERATSEHSIYRDTYFDTPDRALSADGRELRLRTKQTGAQVRHLLTFKAPPVDRQTESKPGYESVVADGELATVVTVPELEDIFLEVEALVDEGQVAEAIAALRELLAELGVDQAQLTTEICTGAVASRRAG